MVIILLFSMMGGGRALLNSAEYWQRSTNTKMRLPKAWLTQQHYGFGFAGSEFKYVYHHGQEDDVSPDPNYA